MQTSKASKRADARLIMPRISPEAVCSPKSSCNQKRSITRTEISKQSPLTHSQLIHHLVCNSLKYCAPLKFSAAKGKWQIKVSFKLFHFDLGSRLKWGNITGIPIKADKPSLTNRCCSVELIVRIYALRTSQLRENKTKSFLLCVTPQFQCWAFEDCCCFVWAACRLSCF
jgi:hypothetical protein